MKIYRH